MKTYLYCSQIILISFAFILIITAACKLISLKGTAQILEVPDPLLHIEYRRLLLLTSIIEIVVSAILFTRINTNTKLYILLWLSSSFVIYRLFLWGVHPSAPCPCLGTLSDALPIGKQVIAKLMAFVLIYLFLGSAALLGISKFLNANRSGTTAKRT